MPAPSDEAPVTPADRTAGTANNSPAIAADPTDARFLALAHRTDAPDFGCSLQLSGDAGRGWVAGQPVTALPAGVEKCYSPEVDFDRDGRLYYLFVGLAGPGNRPVGVYLTHSDDRGRTFTPPQEVLGPAKFSVRMAIDRAAGRIHLVWIDAGSEPLLGGFGASPNPIVASHSDDAGTTFSPPVSVSPPERRRILAPAVALGSDGMVYVAYYDLVDDFRDYAGLEGPVWDGRWSLVLGSSEDRGLTFSGGGVVDDAIVPAARIMLVFTMPPPGLVAVGGEGVCAAWTDARNGDSDVLLNCSRNRGQAWGAVRRVNDDPVGNGRDQYQPRLGVAPDGRIDVVFYDRRLDAGNRLTDAAATYSRDGGLTFAPNIRMSQESSNASLGPRYGVKSAAGLVEIGSRIGLLSTRKTMLAAWTDTRSGDYSSSTQDIFSARVRVLR